MIDRLPHLRSTSSGCPLPHLRTASTGVRPSETHDHACSTGRVPWAAAQADDECSGHGVASTWLSLRLIDADPPDDSAGRRSPLPSASSSASLSRYSPFVAHWLSHSWMGYFLKPLGFEFGTPKFSAVALPPLSVGIVAAAGHSGRLCNIRGSKVVTPRDQVGSPPSTAVGPHHSCQPTLLFRRVVRRPDHVTEGDLTVAHS